MKRRIVLTAFAAAIALSGSAGVLWAAATPGDELSPTPGTDPAVQKWLSNRAADKVALNNVLLAVQQASAPARTDCARLGQLSQRLLDGPRPPAPQLEGPANAGLAQFVVAGKFCERGDFPATHQHITIGLAQRADAQNAVDEILEGDHDGH